jgi:hypothetical protein
MNCEISKISEIRCFGWEIKSNTVIIGIYRSRLVNLPLSNEIKQNWNKTLNPTLLRLKIPKGYSKSINRRTDKHNGQKKKDKGTNN